MFSPSHCYIYAIRTKLIIGTKGKEKDILFPFCSSIVCLYVEFWQTIDGVLLQLIYGTGVFLDVLQAAMTEDAGDGLDVGAIVEEVDSAGMAGAMPTDMFVYTSTFHPSPDRLAATLVGREVEDEGFLGFAFSRSAN